jgi:hypothetical protein
VGFEPQTTSRNCDFELKNGSEYYLQGLIAGGRFEPTTLLSPKGVSTKLTIGKLTEVALQRKPYLVLVLRSSELVPTKEYEGVAEGQGYVLEYVATPK